MLHIEHIVRIAKYHLHTPSYASGCLSYCHVPGCTTEYTIKCDSGTPGSGAVNQNDNITSYTVLGYVVKIQLDSVQYRPHIQGLHRACLFLEP